MTNIPKNPTLKEMERFINSVTTSITTENVVMSVSSELLTITISNDNKSISNQIER